MQANALTRKRYFYSLNIIISHPIVYKEGLGYLSVCAIASRSSPPSHVCICNGHPSLDLRCGHCTGWTIGVRFPVRHDFSILFLPDRLWGPPSLLSSGY
jgi:hypothetical protein